MKYIYFVSYAVPFRESYRLGNMTISLDQPILSMADIHYLAKQCSEQWCSGRNNPVTILTFQLLQEINLEKDENERGISR